MIRKNGLITEHNLLVQVFIVWRVVFSICHINLLHEIVRKNLNVFIKFKPRF